MLSEFIEQGYELEKLKPYEDFLIECSQKDYGELITQEHHILPKNMLGTNKKSNLIPLSWEDHYSAHIILANCFDLKTDERWKNTISAGMILGSIKRLFRKKFGEDFDFLTIDFWNLATMELKSMYSGENNCNFGKEISPERIEKWRKTYIPRKGKDNNFYGKSLLSIWIDKYGVEAGTLKFINMQNQRKERGVNRGERNGMFGISLLKTDEQKQQLSKSLFETSDEKSPLLEGLFRCDEMINGHRKTCYRFCPNPECNKKLHYSNKGIATAAHSENKFCKKCSTGYKECRKFSKQVKDVETGKIYKSKRELMDEFNFPNGYHISKGVKEGKFELLDNQPKLQHLERKRKDGEPFYNSTIFKDLETNKIYISKSQIKKELKLNEGNLNKGIASGKFIIISREEYFVECQ